MRVGFGFDAHRYGDEAANTGHRIMLGGIAVPFDREVLAHSDGDVIIHALCDALLGALALGDIGAHFPDDDPAFEGADSRKLLEACFAKVRQAGLALGNADITLIAERPKVREYIGAMRELLAADLDVDVERISVKATTTERLGFIGREEGLAAQAAVLLE